MKSVKFAVSLARWLGIEELPLERRSGEWWTEFWREMGLNEARRVREAVG